jgi:hypothetical protein
MVVHVLTRKHGASALASMPQLVIMRMQVTSDVSKKKKLQSLAYQLQDVTRAARQQLQASHRTEHVLKVLLLCFICVCCPSRVHGQ